MWDFGAVDSITSLIFKVGLVLAVGFIGGKLIGKLKLPSVTGYLLLGLLLGPSLAIIVRLFDPSSSFEGIVTSADNEALSIISEIALSFIAFSIGSEFSVKSIKKMGNSIMILTIMEVLGAVLLVFTAMVFVPKPDNIFNSTLPGNTFTYAPFSPKNLAFALILASMSAATAPAATLMVMRQYRAYGPVTRTVLPIAALDDIVGIIVFGFCFSVAQMLLSPNFTFSWLMVAKPFIEVFLSLGIGVGIGVGLAFLSRKFDKIRDDIQVLALISIILTLSLTGIINQASSGSALSLNLSPLLANIMVGTMIANFAKKPDRSFNSINDLSTPFYIMFFTLAGAGLDLSILFTSGWIIVVVALAFILMRGSGKILGTRVGAWMAKSPSVIKKWTGWALLPQGGISIGILVIIKANTGEAINEIAFNFIATVIMISILFFETTGPIFSKLAITKAGEVNGLDSLDKVSNVDDLVTEGGK